MKERTIQILVEAKVKGDAKVIRSVIMTNPPAMVFGGPGLSCVTTRTLEVHDEQYKPEVEHEDAPENEAP